MVTKSDILEIKRRLKKDDCTFTRICGCYVNAHHEKVVTFAQNFLNLEDEEYYKYIDIAKKVLSGKLNDQLMQLEFSSDEEEAGGKQQFFMGLRASALKDDNLLDVFYDQIIENYDFVGNYLILLFHDAYDVMTKTEDKIKLDESEEVYEYLLCAICPVVQSKPGLGYLSDENRIGPRIRDWVVSMPDRGFLFPSFAERSTDIHSVTYYVKDAKDSHAEFVSGMLGCGPKKTATEQKQVFHAIVKHAIAPFEEEEDARLADIQETLMDKMYDVMESTEGAFDEEESVLLTTNLIEEALEKNGISEEATKQIKEAFDEEFKEQLPDIKNVIDEKSIEKNMKAKEESMLRSQIEELKQELVTKSFEESGELDEDTGFIKTYDVILRVKPQKADLIHTQVIDGTRCVLIPLEENESVNLNGVNADI